MTTLKDHRLITEANNSFDNIKTIKTRKQKWEEKQLYGYFKRQTSVIAQEMTSIWLPKGNHQSEAKYLLIAAKKQCHNGQLCLSLDL